MSSYFMYWDDLKEAGTLIEYDSSYEIMIDNTKILELTRAKENLKNPNDILKWIYFVDSIIPFDYSAYPNFIF